MSPDWTRPTTVVATYVASQLCRAIRVHGQSSIITVSPKSADEKRPLLLKEGVQKERNTSLSSSPEQEARYQCRVTCGTTRRKCNTLLRWRGDGCRRRINDVYCPRLASPPSEVSPSAGPTLSRPPICYCIHCFSSGRLCTNARPSDCSKFKFSEPSATCPVWHQG
jgi:hypothetical protein